MEYDNDVVHITSNIDLNLFPRNHFVEETLTISGIENNKFKIQNNHRKFKIMEFFSGLAHSERIWKFVHTAHPFSSYFHSIF